MSSYNIIKNKTKELNEKANKIKLSDSLITHLTNPEDRIHYTQLLLETIESYKTQCDKLLEDIVDYREEEKKHNIRNLSMYKLKKALDG